MAEELGGSSGRPGSWGVGLVGDEWTLSELAPHFTPVTRIERGADGWELLSDDFDGSAGAIAVRSRAAELIEILNGLARVRLDAPERIGVGNVRRYRPDGAKDAWVFPEPARLRARVHTPSVMVDGVPVGPPSWERDLAVADEDDGVRAALAFLGLQPTWHTLYAALDVPAHDPSTDARPGIIARGASTAELARFEGTANNFKSLGTAARHGHGTKPHPDPMTLGEAQSLVTRVIEAWLAQKGG